MIAISVPVKVFTGEFGIDIAHIDIVTHQRTIRRLWREPSEIIAIEHTESQAKVLSETYIRRHRKTSSLSSSPCPVYATETYFASRAVLNIKIVQTCYAIWLSICSGYCEFNALFYVWRVELSLCFFFHLFLCRLFVLPYYMVNKDEYIAHLATIGKGHVSLSDSVMFSVL